MQPTNKTARLAAVLYLASGLLAPFSLLYVPGKLIVRGNAAATAQNILQHETLFRVAILFDLFSTIMLIFLAMVLYRLLNNVNRMQAALMVILVLVSIPVSLFSIISEFAALIVVRGPEYLSVFGKPQLDALTMLFLQIRRQGAPGGADLLGAVAQSIRPAGHALRLHSKDPRRAADHQRLRLSSGEPLVAAPPRWGGCVEPRPSCRGTGRVVDHAVASHQRGESGAGATPAVAAA